MPQDYGGLYENPLEKLNFLPDESTGSESNYKMKRMGEGVLFFRLSLLRKLIGFLPKTFNSI